MMFDVAGKQVSLVELLRQKEVERGGCYATTKRHLARLTTKYPEYLCAEEFRTFLEHTNIILSERQLKSVL